MPVTSDAHVPSITRAPTPGPEFPPGLTGPGLFISYPARRRQILLKLVANTHDSSASTPGPEPEMTRVHLTTHLILGHTSLIRVGGPFHPLCARRLPYGFCPVIEPFLHENGHFGANPPTCEPYKWPLVRFEAGVHTQHTPHFLRCCTATLLAGTLQPITE
jgi:hypothetical protein